MSEAFSELWTRVGQSELGLGESRGAQLSHQSAQKSQKTSKSSLRHGQTDRQTHSHPWTLQDQVSLKPHHRLSSHPGLDFPDASQEWVQDPGGGVGRMGARPCRALGKLAACPLLLRQVLRVSGFLLCLPIDPGHSPSALGQNREQAMGCIP